MTPDEARDREAIRATQARLAVDGDRARVSDLLAAYTEDAVVELAAGSYHGKAEIARMMSGVAQGRGGEAPSLAAGPEPGRAFVRHNLTTSHVEFIGPDAAEGRTYFLVTTPIGLDHCGVYTDRFVRVGTEWLISYRRVRVDWMSPDSGFAAPTP